MARFGKLPVDLPAGVKAEIGAEKIKITGPRGFLERTLPRGIKVEQKESQLLVQKKDESKSQSALQGTIRSHLENMVLGVTQGWKKVLEIVGPEYRAELKGNDLILNLGYSNPVEVKAPEGIKFSLNKSIITIEGNNLEQVSQLAAQIRSARKPDPYKGKGIKYQEEVVKTKPGKQAAKGEGVGA